VTKLSSPWDCLEHFGTNILADLLNCTSSWFLWEEFSHAAINALQLLVQLSKLEPISVHCVGCHGQLFKFPASWRNHKRYFYKRYFYSWLSIVEPLVDLSIQSPSAVLASRISIHTFTTAYRQVFINSHINLNNMYRLKIHTQASKKRFKTCILSTESLMM